MQTNDNRRRLTLILLAVAVLLGGLLRFYHLGASELSPDEAASWAAAAAPSVSDVIRQQARFNPGKLAVYELMLHGWIAMFGDGLTAIRALSALLGIGAIVLVFWVARELLMLGRAREPVHPHNRSGRRVQCDTLRRHLDDDQVRARVADVSVADGGDPGADGFSAAVAPARRIRQLRADIAVYRSLDRHQFYRRVRDRRARFVAPDFASRKTRRHRVEAARRARRGRDRAGAAARRRRTYPASARWIAAR